MTDGTALASAYGRAGQGLLAFRLEGMFRQLKTPEDMALHNVIQKEVMLMIGEKDFERDSFYRLLEYELLDRKKKARWSFAKMVENILTKGERK